MRAIRRITVAASLALAAAVMGGCAGPASPPPPEPATLFASDEEAFAAAEATYRAYEDAGNAVDLADPDTFEGLFALTTGEFTGVERRGLSQLHADGLTKTGETRVVYVALHRVSLAYDAIELSACRDYSNLEITDSVGESVVNADRADLQPITVFLESSPLNGTGWLVSGIAAHVGVPGCDS